LGALKHNVEELKMNKKVRMMEATAAVCIGLWASPAAAQSTLSGDPGLGGAGPGKMPTPDELKRMKPKTIEEYNRVITALCNIGGIGIGAITGVFVRSAVSVVAVPVTGTAAGGFYGTTVGYLSAEACMEYAQMTAR
jgi:hypothetical protein